jgi:hypothetical protein
VFPGDDVLRAFNRTSDGSWTCVEPVTIEHPRGRMQVPVGATVRAGQPFMGVDLADWLEERLARYHTRPR